MQDNQITVCGNLTREPELRFTQGGKPVCSFSVASGRRYQVNGEWQEKTTFFDVTVWDKLGENCAASLGKGQRVVVAGRLEIEKYDDKDGNPRTSVKIIADEVGASLRWARATIEKVVRSNPEADTRPASNEELVATGAPSYVDAGEEPF